MMPNPFHLEPFTFIAYAGWCFLIVSDEKTGTREDELEQTE